MADEFGGPIPVGMVPIGLAVTPDGSKVYVANNGSSTVSVIATASNSGSSQTGIALTGP